MPCHSLFRAAARCWERAGRFDLAADRYAQAEAWAEAGRCWAQAERPVEAAEAYARAGEPMSEARQWLASPWAERARRPYRQALQMQLTTAAEVEALLGLGDIELASERAFEVATENGRSVEALRSLARIAAARGRPDWAARAWCQVIALNPAVAQESLAAWEQAAPWNRSLGWRRQQAEASGWPSREFREVGLELIWEIEVGTMMFGNRALAWSPDGRGFAAVENSGSLIMGDLTGRNVQYRPMLTEATSVTFGIESETVLVGCKDGRIAKVDASGDFGEVEALHLSGTVWGVTFSPDGGCLAVTGGSFRQGILQVWSWDDRGPREMLREELIQEEGRINPCCSWSPDGQTLAWCTGLWYPEATPNDLYLFSAASTRRVIAAHGDAIGEIIFSPNGQYLITASSDRTIVIRDTYTGEKVAPPLMLAQKLNTIALHPHAALIAAGGTVDLYEDFRRPSQLYLFRLSQSGPARLEFIQESATTTAVSSLAFSPDGGHLLLSTHEKLSVFRVHLI